MVGVNLRCSNDWNQINMVLDNHCGACSLPNPAAYLGGFAPRQPEFCPTWHRHMSHMDHIWSYLSLESMIERRVSKNPAQRTSQSVKRTSGARVMTNSCVDFDQSWTIYDQKWSIYGTLVKFDTRIGQKKGSWRPFDTLSSSLERIFLGASFYHTLEAQI